MYNINKLTNLTTQNNVLDTKNNLINSKNNKSITTNKTENIVTDSIEILEKNELKINTKKAIDALQEACKETGTVECGGYTCGTMQYHLNTMMWMMEDAGIIVPNFDINDPSTNNNDFLRFIDKVKDFTRNTMTQHTTRNLVPSNFFQFCDLVKEKLIKYGCH